MNAPVIVCLVACIAAAMYALYLRNLERVPAEYHIYHGPKSGCADCESK